LVWVALVPLFFAMDGQRPTVAFALSFLTGLVFFTAFFRWVLDIPGFRLLHQGILGGYVGINFGLFGLGYCYLSRRCSPATALLAAPFLWVPLEYARSNLFSWRCRSACWATPSTGTWRSFRSPL